MEQFRYNGQDRQRAFRLFDAFAKANPFAHFVPHGSGMDWILNKDGYRTGNELLNKWQKAVHSTETYTSNLNVFDHEHGFLVPNSESRRKHRITVAHPGGSEEQWNSTEFLNLLDRFGLASKYGGIERSWYGPTTHLIVVGKPEAIMCLDLTYSV